MFLKYMKIKNFFILQAANDKRCNLELPHCSTPIDAQSAVSNTEKSISWTNSSRSKVEKMKK